MKLHEKQKILKDLIEKINQSDISTIKTTLTQIIRLINDPDAGAKDLKDVIEIDPPLCARLLRRSNSVFYGAPRKFTNIQEAIIWIGFNAVKELALSQKVCELFEKADVIDGYSRKALWQNSVAVALCGKYIYRREFRLGGEDIYTVGLLHNIGIIIEDQFFHDDFEKAVKHFSTGDESLYVAEKSILGITHADIGHCLGKNWNFPDMFSTAIGYHHNPVSGRKWSEEEERLVQTLHIADYICNAGNIGYGDIVCGTGRRYRECLHNLGIEEVALEIILEDVHEEIIRMQEAGWL